MHRGLTFQEESFDVYANRVTVVPRWNQDLFVLVGGQGMSDRKARSLASVLDIATQAFAAHRYEDVRVSAIARAARCSASTIYGAYGDKAALFVEAARHVLAVYFEPVCVRAEGENGVRGAGAVLTRYGRFLLDAKVRGVLRAVICAPDNMRLAFVELHQMRLQLLFDTVGGCYAEALAAGHAREHRADLAVEHAIALVSQQAGMLPLILGEDMGEIDPWQASISALAPFLTDEGLAVLGMAAEAQSGRQRTAA